MMGVFPVGSLVALKSGEIGIVFGLNDDPRLVLRPRIKLIADAEGRKIDGDVVDLAETDPATGRFLRTISAALRPEDYGIEVADYFLAEVQ
jgi:hypothetical protein